VSPNRKIFIAIFCYISALVGGGLALLNARQQPAQTTAAAVFATAAVLFLTGGVALSRRPRY
jgi:hypothetical protein